MSRYALPGMFLILASLGASDSLGGECTDGAEHYMAILEAYKDSSPLEHGSGYGELSEAFDCLTPYPEDYARWAGPIAAEVLARLRSASLRDRIRSACSSYLDIPHQPDPYDPGLAYMAARCLAMHGVTEAKGHDILNMLIGFSHSEKRQLDYYALAAIRDNRVFPLLRSVYDSLESPRSTEEIIGEEVQLVNCLYHVPGDSVLDFVEFIVNSDRDSIVVERADHVLRQRMKDEHKE